MNVSSGEGRVSSEVKTPKFLELYGTAEAVPSREPFMRQLGSVDFLANTLKLQECRAYSA